MKVTHVISRFNKGGTSHWLNLLIDGLGQLGVVGTLYAGYVQNGETEDPNFLRLGGIKFSFGNDLRSFFELRNQIKNRKPDIVNTHTTKAGVIGRLVLLTLAGEKPKLVHTIHGHLLYGYFPSWKIKIYIYIERILAKATDVLIVPGERVRDELLAAGVGEFHQFKIVSPGVTHVDMERNSAKNSKILSPNKNLRIGWMGRITQIKRPDRVVEIAKSFPDIDFLIAGEGDLLLKLRGELLPNIHLVGWAEPTIFWNQVDIAILTSDNEAIPISLIEAAMSGLPIIAENVGSVEEIVFPGRNGFLTNSKFERILAVESLQRDANLRDFMGRESRAIASSKFSVHSFLDNHFVIYKSLINSE